MKKILKNIFLLFVAISMFVVANVFVASDADAAAKKKKVKASLSQEQLDTMNKDLNLLTRKVYANSLFSPSDNEKMINIKLDLDVAMIQVAAPEYAPMYYMEANLLRKRHYNAEAIECYQTIMENFGDTAFGPKARQELLKMGVKIEVPTTETEEEEALE